MRNLLPAAVALCVAVGCGTAHTARPLGKGRHAVHLSLGGPIAGVGSPDYPLPLTTLTYKAGLTDRADFFVGWHVLETFLNRGNLYFDVGASYYLLDQKGGRPGVSAAFTLSPLINARSAWASVDLQLTASWAFGPRERHLVYVGFHNTFTPMRTGAVATAPYSFSPYLGGQLRIGKLRRFGLGVELKWLRPYVSTKDAVVQYVGIGPQGALSLVGGFTVYIGKEFPERTAFAASAPPSEEAAPASSRGVPPAEGAAPADLANPVPSDPAPADPVPSDPAPADPAPPPPPPGGSP